MTLTKFLLTPVRSKVVSIENIAVIRMPFT